MEEKYEMISQSNALTQSRYDFSTTEKNVLYRIIQKVRNEYVEGTINRTVFENFYVTISSADLSKIADEDHTKRAREALRKLRHRDIEMEDEEGRWLNVGYINYAKYDPKSKSYEVEVSKEIMPHLVELANCFTTYSLTVAISLKSKYSQRFYEFCCQYKNRGSFFIDKEKLRSMMKLDGKYEQNQDIKRYVLEPAYKELKEAYENGQSDLYFEYSIEGRGKNVRYNLKVMPDNSAQAVDYEETKKKMDYIYRKALGVFRKDPKFCERILAAITFNPDKVQPVFDKLTKLEKDYSGADLAKILRYVLNADFEIK